MMTLCFETVNHDIESKATTMRIS